LKKVREKKSGKKSYSGTRSMAVASITLWTEKDSTYDSNMGLKERVKERWKKTKEDAQTLIFGGTSSK